MSTPANALNITTSGLVKFDGTNAFSAVTTTNHDVLVGATSNGITSVAPSATTGVPLISQGAAADPAFGTAVVAGGGTGATTLTGIVTGNGTSAFTANAVTQHGVLIGGAANAASSLGVAATGTVLTGVTGADPAFSATPTVTSITFGSGSALSTYTTNTFTPSVTFGGGSTGITYTTQTGQYWQIGAVVHVSMQIVLSNKGSSTGVAEITGLPVTTRAGSIAILPCLTGNISGGGTSVFPVFLAPDASGTKGVVYLSNTAAGVTALADTNFTNTSFIDCTGFYFNA